MSNYRRWFVPGGTYFFTVVTYHRYPFFRDPSARQFLGDAIRQTQADHPFELFAIVLLWDHLHCLWNLPPGDSDYPSRWKAIYPDYSWASSWRRQSAGSNPQCKRGQALPRPSLTLRVTWMP